MSRATLYVRFPDGTLRYGLWNGSNDFAYAELTDTPKHAWEGYRDDIEPGAEVWVDVATDYGGGFAWRGKATKLMLTHGRDPEQFTENTLPDWAIYPKVE